MNHQTRCLIVGLVAAYLPLLGRSQTNDIIAALAELETLVASNVVKAVAANQVEPLRVAAWEFGQFRENHVSKGNDDSDVTLRMNRIRLMLIQAAFKMRTPAFDLETEREKQLRQAQPQGEDALKTTVFNREVTLENIYKGFLGEVRSAAPKSSGQQGDAVSVFHRMVDEIIVDDALKREICRQDIAVAQRSAPSLLAPVSHIFMDGSNVVFKLRSSSSAGWPVKTNLRDMWFSSPGEEVTVPIGGSLLIISNGAALTFDPLPGDIMHVGFHVKKIVEPRSSKDNARPTEESLLLVKSFLRNADSYPDTAHCSGLILTNVPVHAISRLLNTP